MESSILPYTSLHRARTVHSQSNYFRRLKMTKDHDELDTTFINRLYKRIVRTFTNKIAATIIVHSIYTGTAVARISSAGDTIMAIAIDGTALFRSCN
jgi:hypothetical protein